MYLAEQQVGDVEHHAQGELGSEEGKKPLGGIHVRLQVQLLEVGPQVWKLFLSGGAESCEIKQQLQQYKYEAPVVISIWNHLIFTHTLLNHAVSKIMISFKSAARKDT